MTEIERFNVNNKGFFRCEKNVDSFDNEFIYVYDCYSGKSGDRKEKVLAKFSYYKDVLEAGERKIGVKIPYEFVTKYPKQFHDFMDILRYEYASFYIPIDFFV